ncbi:hypothetical protein CYMTET_33209, partial [Cymbomonas tetramitiformis]
MQQQALFALICCSKAYAVDLFQSDDTVSSLLTAYHDSGLAHRALSIDVFDGDSVLQHGTITVDLRGLLRQGREFSEVLLECPVLDHREAMPEEAARNRRRRGALRAAQGISASTNGLEPASGSGAVARGTLLLRAINIGRTDEAYSRQPAAGVNLPPGQRVAVKPAQPGTAVHKTRVRAVPESGGTVAAELQANLLAPSQRAE